MAIVYDAMKDRPELAWKYLERREKGFAPALPTAPTGPTGPVIIQLSLHDGSLPPVGAFVNELIEGEVVEQYEVANPITLSPA